MNYSYLGMLTHKPAAAKSPISPPPLLDRRLSCPVSEGTRMNGHEEEIHEEVKNPDEE